MSGLITYNGRRARTHLAHVRRPRTSRPMLQQPIPSVPVPSTVLSCTQPWPFGTDALNYHKLSAPCFAIAASPLYRRSLKTLVTARPARMNAANRATPSASHDCQMPRSGQSKSLQQMSIQAPEQRRQQRKLAAGGQARRRRPQTGAEGREHSRSRVATSDQ